jgi:hypothetical protein
MTPTKNTTMSTSADPATPAQASLYQQLRGHLAVLKLHDAAEHLPTVLDAARTEHLTITAALERLLAIEVGATEAAGCPGGSGSPRCPPRPACPTSTTTPPPTSTGP